MSTKIKLSTSASQVLHCPEAEAIYGELREDGYSIFISKKAYSKIVHCSVSSVDNYIKKGYGIPNYKKMGKAKNSKVLFSLIDVANYLAKTIETA